MKWDNFLCFASSNKCKWKCEMDLASLKRKPMMGVWDEPSGSLKSRKCLEQRNITLKKTCKMLLGLHIVYIHQYTLYPDFIQIFVLFLY